MADTLTLNSQHSTLTLTLTQYAARVRESSRVRTDGGTYILLETTTTVAIVLLHNNNNNNNNNQPMQETVLSLLQLVPDLLIVVREHRDGEWHFVLPSSGSLKGRSMVCFSSSVVVGRRSSVVGRRSSVVGGGMWYVASTTLVRSRMPVFSVKPILIR